MTARRQQNCNVGRAWEDNLLDLVVNEAVTGKTVAGRWKSAAHRATEMLIGCDLATVGTSAAPDVRTAYRWVLDAITYLEDAGLIKVSRVRPQDGPGMGNPIERIEVAL
jgi:hypothetical protein